MNRTILVLGSVLSLAAAACGDNIDLTRADARTSDARVGGDGPSGIDARPVDALVAAVTVTAGLCATADHIVTNNGPDFRLDGGATNNPPMVFAVGDAVSIDLGVNHNFVSGTGTPLQFQFRSGALGDPACLTFTAPIPASASVDYACENDASTNTLVVN